MKYRTLGKTGLEVSEIGFGGEWLERHPEEEGVELIHYASSKGINILDCWMPDPKSRDIIGKGIKDNRSQWFIQGHIGSTWKDGQYYRTREMEYVRPAFEDLLKRMQTDYIDLGMIHYVDSEEEWEQIQHSEYLDYVMELKEKGIIHHIGMSSHNPKVAKKQIYEINKEVEKARLLKASQAKKSEYGDSAKYVIFATADKKGNETDGKIKVTMNEKLIKKNLELAGYNLLVTSEIAMSDKDVYDAYHNLWRIEESFRIMKSQLDARPVYLQKEDTIVGHFLICYLAVLLTRLLQFKILKNNYCSEDLFDFIRDFRVAKISDRKYINLSRGTTFIKEFAAFCNLPLTSYFLSDGEIKKMLSHRF